jgi:hypothetical protein
MQLQPYHRVFGPERVRVVTLEALKTSPDRVVQELFAWLGVDGTHVPEDVGRQNVTSRDVFRMRGPRAMRRLRSWGPLSRVKPSIPWRVRLLVRRLCDVRVDRESPDMADLVEYLRPRQREETKELSRMLGRDFPEWRTLYPRSGAEE